MKKLFPILTLTTMLSLSFIVSFGTDFSNTNSVSDEPTISTMNNRVLPGG